MTATENKNMLKMSQIRHASAIVSMRAKSPSVTLEELVDRMPGNEFCCRLRRYFTPAVCRFDSGECVLVWRELYASGAYPREYYFQAEISLSLK